jgi:imidazolonepropionase-like amidohydrolase
MKSSSHRQSGLGPALLATALTAAIAPIASAAGAAPLAITGATVHTLGPAGTLRNATVVVDGGRIVAVGPNVAVPAGARVIDATGKVVTPGLFDSLSRLGLVEVGAVKGSNDAGSASDHATAALDVTDAFDRFSTPLAVNRIEGITRAMVAPTPGPRLIAGRGAIVDLGGEIDSVIRPRAALFAVLGEAGAGIVGGSRAAAVSWLREALADARDYAVHRDEAERGARRSYVLSRLDLDALLPVARGEMPLVVTVHRASDIEAALRLAKEEKLKLILAGATEAWKVAPQIAAAKVPVLLDVTSNLPSSFERLGATLENAARLQAAGVTFALMSGEAHNSRNLKQAAGNAVAYGLPWEAALAAMTLNPARIWGIADRLGSIEPGKDADLVIWDGDPLEVTTFADQVLIRGREIPMESRQTQLRDRYLQPTKPGELPPVYRLP